MHSALILIKPNQEENGTCLRSESQRTARPASRLLAEMCHPAATGSCFVTRVHKHLVSTFILQPRSKKKKTKKHKTKTNNLTKGRTCSSLKINTGSVQTNCSITSWERRTTLPALWAQRCPERCWTSEETVPARRSSSLQRAAKETAQPVSFWYFL